MSDTDNKDLIIPNVKVYKLLDAFARHYGLGLDGAFGKFSGCESIAHHAFDGGEKQEIHIDDFIALLESGIMVYESKDVHDVPPINLNNALTDLIHKNKDLKELILKPKGPKLSLIK